MSLRSVSAWKAGAECDNVKYANKDATKCDISARNQLCLQQKRALFFPSAPPFMSSFMPPQCLMNDAACIQKKVNSLSSLCHFARQGLQKKLVMHAGKLVLHAAHSGHF